MTIPALSLSPISKEEAKAYFEKYSAYRGEFDSAICVREGDVVHGVIAVIHDGKEFKLGHIYTDGSAFIGSLLYGAAWRVAKAMGYKTVTI